MDIWHICKNKVNREDLLKLVSIIIESILPVEEIAKQHTIIL
jgi:hypothetical protein